MSKSGRRSGAGSGGKDGVHLVVDELCHTPRVSPTKRASARSAPPVATENGAEGRRGTASAKRASRRDVNGDGSGPASPPAGGSPATASPTKRKSRNVALVEFVAGPVNEPAPPLPSSSASPSTSSSSPLPASSSSSGASEAEMRNGLLEDLEQSIKTVEKERIDNLTELFFLQVCYYCYIMNCTLRSADFPVTRADRNVDTITASNFFSFFQNHGMMMDYFPWKKKRTPQLMFYLKTQQVCIAFCFFFLIQSHCS